MSDIGTQGSKSAEQSNFGEIEKINGTFHIGVDNGSYCKNRPETADENNNISENEVTLMADQYQGKKDENDEHRIFAVGHRHTHSIIRLRRIVFKLCQVKLCFHF